MRDYSYRSARCLRLLSVQMLIQVCTSYHGYMPSTGKGLTGSDAGMDDSQYVILFIHTQKIVSVIVTILSV